jgi:hypothetical protein
MVIYTLRGCHSALAARFKACASFMSAGGGCWLLMAARGHARKWVGQVLDGTAPSHG